MNGSTLMVMGLTAGFVALWLLAALGAVWRFGLLGLGGALVVGWLLRRYLWMAVTMFVLALVAERMSSILPPTAP